MSIINRNNLLIAEIGTAGDKKLPALGNIHITSDGDSVACNGRTIIIVQGVDEERKKNIPFGGAGKLLRRATTLPVEFATALAKATPKDTQFGGLLELIRLEESGKEGVVKTVSHDGKGEKILRRQEYTREFIDFKGIINKLLFRRKSTAQLVLDRTRLIKALQTFDKLCGDSPCYIDVMEGGNLLVRSIIPSTGQRVLALITGVIAPWVPLSNFERKYDDEFQVLPPKRKLVRRRK